MVNRSAYCPIVLFCVSCLSVVIFVSHIFAGEAADLVFIREANPMTTPKAQEVVRFNPQETSELKLVATGLIRLYQKFISSQDGAVCGFAPSCSRFGMGCIQEYGFARGVLLASDRLLRCNGSKSRYYHKDGVTGKYVDPVSDYAVVK